MKAELLRKIKPRVFYLKTFLGDGDFRMNNKTFIKKRLWQGKIMMRKMNLAIKKAMERSIERAKSLKVMNNDESQLLLNKSLPRKEHEIDNLDWYQDELEKEKI